MVENNNMKKFYSAEVEVTINKSVITVTVYEDGNYYISVLVRNLFDEPIKGSDKEYIMTGWVKTKVLSHWKTFGKVKTFIYRDFARNTVTIDFCGGGRCATYTYDGKWIAG